MKLVLVLMIKNEEKILKRCLEAVENIVDCFCITDTGSTDSSVEIATEFLKTHTGNVATDVWKNFGHNRTLSLRNAQEYVKTLDWNMAETYALLLDADMVFVPNVIKHQDLKGDSYKIIQENGNLEFFNTRFIRMDLKVDCIGVTHEYWATSAITMPKEVCYISDIGDGGSKGDKFERDKRLLEQGLIDEPTNGRYMFYLAQTLKDSNDLKEAIAMYKKRIAVGGWQEEVWHSYYSIGQCYRRLNNIPKYECWMNKAFEFYSVRSEPLLDLARFFREKAQHYKAYYYCMKGIQVPFPKNDVLFIEPFPYKGGFFYEASILEYYIHPEKGLKSSITYLLQRNEFQQNVLSNLKFYVTPVKSVLTPIILPSVFGEKYRPSAISVAQYPMANVRYINYTIENGEYKTPNDEAVDTKNAFINLKNKKIKFKLNDSLELPKFETRVKGLEDLRIHENNGKLYFFATSVGEYSEHKIRMVTGEYPYANCKVLESPTNVHCEKNWLPIKNTNKIIYNWSPLTILEDDKIIAKYEAPPFFKLFRGSAPPIQWESKWLVLVHIVEYSKPRNYYHCFLELNDTWKPNRLSLPFTFKGSGIEYCISTRQLDSDTVQCFVSFNDSNPHSVDIKYTDIPWTFNLN